MKLAVLWLCVLHLAFVGARLFSPSDRHRDRNDRHRKGGRAPAPQGTGSLIQGRQRPLFARRGQYERQRIHVQKPKAVPTPPNDLPPPFKVPPKPVKPNCSQLTQSCLPQSGCCDPRASCHCRFFNAICFCRRTNSLHEKKTLRTPEPPKYTQTRAADPRTDVRSTTPPQSGTAVYSTTSAHGLMPHMDGRVGISSQNQTLKTVNELTK